MIIHDKHELHPDTTAMMQPLHNVLYLMQCATAAATKTGEPFSNKSHARRDLEWPMAYARSGLARRHVAFSATNLASPSSQAVMGVEALPQRWLEAEQDGDVGSALLSSRRCSGRLRAWEPEDRSSGDAAGGARARPSYSRPCSAIRSALGRQQDGPKFRRCANHSNEWASRSAGSGCQFVEAYRRATH